MVKLARVREADAWAGRERLRAAWLGSLIPGGGWWYRGSPLGAGWCLVSFWILAEGIALDLVTPSLRFAPLLPESLRWTAALVLLAGLHGLSIWWSRRPPASRSREERGRMLRDAPRAGDADGGGFESLGVRG